VNAPAQVVTDRMRSAAAAWAEGAALLALLRFTGIWIALAALYIYGGVDVPNFLTTGNIRDILSLVPALGIIALGQTFVVVVGGLDLSVGSLASLVSVLTVGLISGNAGLAWVIPLGLAIGVGVGLFNGAAVVLTGVNPVIVTFGMLSVLSGAAFSYTQGSIGTTVSALKWFDSAAVGGVVPASAVLLLIHTVVAAVALARTPFGRYVQAVGGNRASALRTGIPVARITIASYVLSGLSGAIAGMLLGARLGTGYPQAGSGLELSAIVAVTLGGTRFGGGRGTILGSVAGVFLLSSLANLLNLRQADPSIQQIVNGAVVVAAVALYSNRRSRQWA
jgi:ribose transport system permease protein